MDRNVKTMKKKIFILSLIALCVSLCLVGTVAFFAADRTARNVITAGNLQIELVETDGNGHPFEDVFGVIPGEKIAKVVAAKNPSERPCFVRISVDKRIQLAQGVTGTPDLSLVAMDFNTTDWIEQDGYFYYTRILNPGETTEPLFTTVSFDAAMNNLYKGSAAKVIVDVQAVQSANNGDTALAANGWPEQ